MSAPGVDRVEVDLVVAGGGVGGAMAAYHAARVGARVLYLGGSGGASARISSFNTALGYDDPDTPDGIVEDMLRAGRHVNHPGVVRALADRVAEETMRLVEMDVPFVRDGDRLARRQAAGSTWTRAVFSRGMIGADIVRALTERLVADESVTVVNGGLLVDVETADGAVCGVLAWSPRDERWMQIGTRAVVMATGGAGQLWASTTNPRGSLGTGYAVALEAGAELMDMEFTSFEPFITSAPPEHAGHDLPTTVLREGARLLNARGEAFLPEQSPTKDIICRAMVREVLEGRGTASGSVVFDLTEMDPDNAERYVGIVEALRKRGITSREAQLEVMPAQHYVMGGIRIDERGRSTLPGMYAVGEAAGGAHGAHRLAAGGGLEVVAGGAVVGEAAGLDALSATGDRRCSLAPNPDLLSVRLAAEAQADLGLIRGAMDSGCGILRTATDLEDTVTAVEEVHQRHRVPGGHPFVRRAAMVALSIARSAAMREESRGDHFRTDHPHSSEEWLANIVVTAPAGEMEFTTAPVPTATTVA
ncbi:MULTISPECIES: FAD-binding protein [unclassified Nocardioides]|uniref:FAD-binding protein n=1 Tax=unclassified Nocardioides TaxID=2615069 RepID=UPI00005715E7|nr:MULTISPECIES: FAD-binding protein [unclassified Nocardioides]ABL79582.1 fumarate reductase/succinate dehydrogenase flavoprotein domain protein [Nocardioides sp. JS614]